MVGKNMHMMLAELFMCWYFPSPWHAEAACQSWDLIPHALQPTATAVACFLATAWLNLTA